VAPKVDIAVGWSSDDIAASSTGATGSSAGTASVATPSVAS
jgi:hypothetical protein